MTRGTLRTLLSFPLDERPQSIPIQAGPNGKPYIAGEGHGIHFNVSHSADTAMICIATCGDVGVDLEAIRDVPDAVALARRHFAPVEAGFVEAGGAAEAAGRFLLCWTRKEALVKAIGTGLNIDLRGFVVPLTSPGANVPIDDPEGGPRRHWLLLDVHSATSTSQRWPCRPPLRIAAPSRRQCLAAARWITAKRSTCRRTAMLRRATWRP